MRLFVKKNYVFNYLKEKKKKTLNILFLNNNLIKYKYEK